MQRPVDDVHRFQRETFIGSRELRVIRAGAGGAARLPGMVASVIPFPGIGGPAENTSLKRLDPTLSRVRMPGGVAVGGRPSAGLLALRMLGEDDPAAGVRRVSFQTRLAKESHPEDRKLRAEVGTQSRL